MLKAETAAMVAPHVTARDSRVEIFITTPLFVRFRQQVVIYEVPLGE